MGLLQKQVQAEGKNNMHPIPINLFTRDYPVRVRVRICTSKLVNAHFAYAQIHTIPFATALL